MKFGIHIGHMGGPLDEMRKLWKFADANGFDWFSVSDHFQESPPRGGDMDCYEAIATLTAAAMDTKHVRLGSGVYCVAYRNPGLLAKSLTTIDHLSGGRVDCGLGAGWHDVEAKAFGFPFPAIGPREDMLEEYAQIMRLLFDAEQPRVTFEGRHFQMQNAPNNPKPLQPRIPIWIGGRGEKRTLRAAARSVRFSPRPPIQMGIRGCSGLGLLGALATWKCLPWKLARFCSGSRSSRMICAYSSSMSSRGPIVGNGMPNALASTSCQPAPSPQSTRPCERWSIVVSDLASSPGLR